MALSPVTVIQQSNILTSFLQQYLIPVYSVKMSHVSSSKNWCWGGGTWSREGTICQGTRALLPPRRLEVSFSLPLVERWSSQPLACEWFPWFLCWLSPFHWPLTSTNSSLLLCEKSKSMLSLSFFFPVHWGAFSRFLWTHWYSFQRLGALKL